MIGFAGTILEAYTPAQRYFAGPQPRGRVRLGMSDDLALTRLPEILRAFRAEHPRIDIELMVDQSGSLHRRLERNHLDLFLGKRPVDGPPGVLVRRDPLIWIGTPGASVDPTRPLPLVLYPAPSISRTHMLAALEQGPARLPDRVPLPRLQRARRRGVRRHRDLGRARRAWCRPRSRRSTGSTGCPSSATSTSSS